MTTTLKTPEQLAREAIDARYGIGTRWEEPDDEGREGLARAQAETLAETGESIDADDLRTMLQDAVQRDRRQVVRALASHDSVPGVRPFQRAAVSALIDAYAEWDGEVDTFVLAWENFTAGLDFPCPEHPSGIHSTYLAADGSCDYCGDKNRG